jgi:hypothetical protein
VAWHVPRAATTHYALAVTTKSKGEIYQRHVQQETQEQSGKRFMQKMEETQWIKKQFKKHGI